MKLRDECLTGALAITLCAAVVFIVAVPTLACALDTSAITRLNMPNDGKERLSSDGHLIAYEVNRDNLYNPIAVYDTRTEAETIIGPGCHAAVAGDSVVYAGSGGIYRYDSASGDTTLAAAYDHGTQVDYLGADSELAAYGGMSGYGIVGVDLASGSTFLVTDNPDAVEPDAGDGWIVYTVIKPTHGPSPAGGYMQGDIMGYNVASGRTYVLCNETHDQRNPRISSKGMVVWDDERRNGDDQWEHDKTDVYGCSVANRVNFAVAAYPGVQRATMVDGSIIGYFDERAPGGYCAMGVDLATGVHFGMVSPSYFDSSSGFSGLAGGTVLWNKGADMYTATPTQMSIEDADDPYTNAAVASREAFPNGCDSIVVASGQSWVDDLAAASIAETDSPLLLTGKTSLPKATADEIDRLGATQAIFLGGEGEISSAVQAQVQALLDANIAVKRTSFASLTIGVHGSIQRISGSRYAVTDAVARRLATQARWDGTVMVASASMYTDALSASPLSGARGIPVLLSGAKGLGSKERALLRSVHARRIVILGGRHRVPSVVDAQARAIVGKSGVVRLSGSDAYSVAVSISSYAHTHYGLSWNRVGVVSSRSFTSLLTAGLRQARSGSVLLLTDPKRLVISSKAAMKAHHKSIRSTRTSGVTKTARAQMRLVLH